MSGRRVIASPFAFAGTPQAQPSQPSQPSQVIEPPSFQVAREASKGAKYAPPPTIDQTKSTPPPSQPPPASVPQPTNQTRFPPSAPGGKLSAFAELSNKPPPPLYQSPQAPPQQPNFQSHAAAQPPPQQQQPNFQQNIHNAPLPSPAALIPNEDPEHIPTFLTKSNPIPPPAARKFTVLDQGNCGPRYMRSTSYTLPNSTKLASEINLPIGVVVQPLADPEPGDTQIPIVQPNPALYRCARCGGYHSSLDKFDSHGKKYICFLCGFANDVPAEYFSPIGGDGFRADINSRPELYNGSVEFIAPSEYITSSPVPLSFVFVIETTHKAASLGVIQALRESLTSILRSLPKNSPAKFAFITFNDMISFYNINSERTVPQVLVMTDTENHFLPGNAKDFLLRYTDAPAIDKFLELLPSLCKTEANNETCTAAAMRTAGLLLKDHGGKIIVFQSSMPTVGLGALVNRYKAEYLGTSRERELYVPHTNYYSLMGKDCSNHQISFDIFMFPAQGEYIDAASVAPLCKLTGGQLYYYPRFQYQNDRLTMHNELFRILTRTSGLNAVMRIRTSPGIEISSYRGCFQLKNDCEMHFSCLSCDTMVGINLKITDTIPDESMAGIQCVLLYTTSFGERRIRVHSLQIPVSQHIGKVIASADLDSILFLNCVNYSKECLTKDLSKIREAVVEDCVAPLVAFRKKCATNSIGLALPDSLRLYPIYQLCMLKSPLLKDTRISVDYRVAERLKIFNLPLRDVSLYLYPRMFALHQLGDRHGEVAADGSIILPPWQRLSKDSLKQDGCYLLDNTNLMLMWVGLRADSAFLQEVFGVPSLTADATVRLSVGESSLVRKINAIINCIRSQHTTYPPLYIILQGSSQDLAFAISMREDRVEDTMSYGDMMAYLNRSVSQKLGL